MEAVKRKRQASEVDLQGEEKDSSVSPKTKKSPSGLVLENPRDVVVILDAGSQYGKVNLQTKNLKWKMVCVNLKLNYYNCSLLLYIVCNHFIVFS